MKPQLTILPKAQKWAWPRLSEFQDFVLYGGTALALRHGHRQSVDFDFFSSKPFDPLLLKNNRPLLKHGKTIQTAPNTLTVLIYDPDKEPIKISLFGGLTFGRTGKPDIIPENKLRIASDLDLAVQKLKVIQTRASTKDYIDLDTLIQTGTKLEEALAAAEAIFPNFPILVALKALTYHKDLQNLPPAIKLRLTKAAGDFKHTSTTKFQIVPLDAEPTGEKPSTHKITTEKPDTPSMGI
jgi:hypothetical protein